MINENYYENFDRKENLHFDSKVVHGALGCDPITGAVSFPIFQTSTFRHQINPALLTETYTGMPFLGNLNIGAQGNVGLKNFVYKLDGNPNYDLTTFMNPEVSASEFLGDLGDKNRINIHLNENIFSTAFSAFVSSKHIWPSKVPSGSKGRKVSM